MEAEQLQPRLPSLESGVEPGPSPADPAATVGPSDVPQIAQSAEEPALRAADPTRPTLRREARIAELVERLGPRLSRSSEGLHVEEHADGRGTLDLRGRYQHAVVVSRGADGRVRSECVSHPEAAARALGAEASATSGGHK